MANKAVLSIDYERFSDIPATRNVDLPEQGGDVALAGIEWLRERFAEAGVSTTIFAVSDFAEATPETIEGLTDDGHEIASHTCTHRHLSDLNPDERRGELERSRTSLERLCGRPVLGFRAPSFDIPADHFESVSEAGYAYDSSVVPSRSIPGWYGGRFDAMAPTAASTLVESAPAELTEVPLAVWPRLRLPLSGAWLRFFGVRYVLVGMHRLSRLGITPVLYVHPWELANPPRVDGVSRRVYWRTGPYARRAVDRLLDSAFDFVPIRDVLAEGAGGST